MKYYLKTSYACNLYEIYVAQWDKVDDKVDESQYVVFDESKIPYFEKLLLKFMIVWIIFGMRKALMKKASSAKTKTIVMLQQATVRI